MPVLEEVSARSKTKTIKVTPKRIPQVTKHITEYKRDESITFTSDCAVYLAFDNWDVFKMDGLFLEAGEAVVANPQYPYETNIYVSMEEKQTAGAQTTGGRALMKVYCADPPKIVPGEYFPEIS